GAGRVTDHRLRQVEGGDGCFAQTDRHHVPAGGCLRFDRKLVPAWEDEQPAFRARMLDGRAQQRLDQLFQDDLARDRLRDLDHRREVELVDRRADGGRLTGSRRLLAEVRVGVFELPHLAVRAPAEITVAGVAQAALRDARQTSVRVEARRKLLGERLVVDEAVRLRREGRPLVEVHRLERAAFQASDLRADQRGAVREILRAMLRQDCQLTVAAGHRLEVLSAFAGLDGIAGSGVRKRREEAVVRPREYRGLGPEQPLRPGGGIEGLCRGARKEARLQLADPPPALRERLTLGARQVALELALVEVPVIESAERPRQATERADEPEMRSGRVDHEPEAGVPRKLDVELG